jgi:hypothetical protein
MKRITLQEYKNAVTVVGNYEGALRTIETFRKQSRKSPTIQDILDECVERNRVAIPPSAALNYYSTKFGMVPRRLFEALRLYGEDDFSDGLQTKLIDLVLRNDRRVGGNNIGGIWIHPNVGERTLSAFVDIWKRHKEQNAD